jgi:hypothetical protein
MPQINKQKLNALAKARANAAKRPAPKIPFLEEAKKPLGMTAELALNAIELAGFAGGRRRTHKRRTSRRRRLTRRL